MSARHNRQDKAGDLSAVGSTREKKDHSARRRARRKESAGPSVPPREAALRCKSVARDGESPRRPAVPLSPVLPAPSALRPIPARRHLDPPPAPGQQVREGATSSSSPE